MSNSHGWFLDPGASFHLTSDIKLLRDFQDLKKPEEIVDASGNVVLIRGRGLVKTEKLNIPDVHYAEGLTPGFKIISVLKLVNDCNLVPHFTSTHCSIRDSKTQQEVGRASLNKGWYMLDYLLIGQDILLAMESQEKSKATVSQEKSKATVSQEQPQVETAWPYSWGQKTSGKHIESEELVRRFGARVRKTSGEHTESEEWVLDSGAWVHHTSNYKLLYGDRFYVTDNDLQMGVDVLHIFGHGSVRTDGFEVPGVYYVEGDVRNVISVQQLSRDHGLVTVFESTHCYVRYRDNGQIAGWGRLRNGVYVLDSLLISQNIGGNESGHHEGGSGGGGGSGTRGHEGGRGDGRDGGGEGSRGGGAAGGHGGDGRDSGGEGSRGGGDEQINDDIDDHLEEDQDDDNEVEDNTKGLQKVDMFGVLQFIWRIITTALDYIIPSRFQRGSEARVTEEENGRRDLEKSSEAHARLFGLSRNIVIEEENGRRHLEESSEVHARLFGLSRNMARDPSGNLYCELSTSAFPTLSSEARCKEFLVDSGASFHTAWNEMDLSPYMECEVNYTEPPIRSFGGIGPGSVEVTRSGYLDTHNIMLDGILLAPLAQANLVSVGQLTNQYFVAVEMDHEGVTITNKSSGLKIGGGKMKRYGHHFVLERFQPGELRTDMLRLRLHNMFGKSIFSRPPRRFSFRND